jgi:hypothetical protein
MSEAPAVEDEDSAAVPLLGPAVEAQAPVPVPLQVQVVVAPVVLPQRAVPAAPLLPEAVVALAAEEDLEARVEPVQPLHNRQLFSAVMARTTPRRTAPYELVPKSR